MRTKLIESNKPEKYIHSIRNVDTSAAGATIPAGSPLVLNLSGTPQPSTYQNGLQPGWEDGLQVVLPNTAGATNTGTYFYGIAAGPVLYQQYGESMVHGVAQGLIVRGTRSATSASWASSASSSCAGFSITVDTANNAFGVAAAAGTRTDIVIVDNLASAAGSATNASDTRTAAVTMQRVFVRLM